jgi:hypothetical protein
MDSCIKYAVKYPCPESWSEHFFKGERPDVWACASIIRPVEVVKFENAILTGSLAKAKAKAKELKGKVYAVSVTATAIV